MSDPAEALQKVNNKLLAGGQSFPQVTLADGTKVQTGTIAGLIANVKRYNEGERGEVEDSIRLALPILVKSGLLGLFPPSDWIKGDNPGRRFVGESAVEFLQASEAAKVPPRA